MELSRQGYWNGLPFPSPVDLSNPGIELRSPALQADSLWTELQGQPRALLSKALIQLSADGWGCVPSLLVVWPEVTQSWGLWALWQGYW